MYVFAELNSKKQKAERKALAQITAAANACVHASPENQEIIVRQVLTLLAEEHDVKQEDEDSNNDENERDKRIMQFDIKAWWEENVCGASDMVSVEEFTDKIKLLPFYKDLTGDGNSKSEELFVVRRADFGCHTFSKGIQNNI